MKNSYAKKLLLAKEILTKEREREIIEKTIKLMIRSIAIALNRELGMGAGRISRVQSATLQVFREYSDMQDTDQEYADERLKEAYEAIMRGSDLGD